MCNERCEAAVEQQAHAVRAQFEAWVTLQGRSTNTWVETGEYTHYDTRRCWEAWQAALTAAQQQGQAVGEAGAMPGTSGGFTTAVFKAADVPVGTKLYTAPPRVPDGGCGELVKMIEDMAIYGTGVMRVEHVPYADFHSQQLAPVDDEMVEEANERMAIAAYEKFMGVRADDPAYGPDLYQWMAGWNAALATQHKEPTT